jgi:sterol desaturase/sphingolipid hydroxylase (fatty acid hydroxylase superfamily)
MPNQLQKVDHSALKANQAFIIAFLVLGFLFNAPVIVALVALAMLVGTAFKRPGFGPFYNNVLKPLGLVRPDVLNDNPEPHRFAQGFGGVVLVLAVLGFVLGSAVIGWGLTWLVIALAALNLFAGFCAGCAVYYWLHQLNAPGFVKAPPPNTFPGMRPKER